METNMKSFIEKNLEIMMAAPHVCPEAVEAAKVWLAAKDTDDVDVATKALVAELKEDAMTMPMLREFADSDFGKQIFGDNVGEFLAHVDELEKKGIKYCDCPACTAAGEIIEAFE